MRRPFFWKERQCWYVKDASRKNIRLDPDEQTALKMWAELANAEQPESPTAPVAAVANAFVSWAQTNVSAKTFRGYGDFIKSFCNLYAHVRVRELKPFHVTRWLEKQSTWGTETHRGAIAAVKRMFNWAVEEGLLERNPLAKVRKPSAKRREILITDDQHARMMLANDSGREDQERVAAFRAVMIALKHSGARPGMVASVQVENVSPGVDAWIMAQHKTRKKTGKPLIIYLSPCLQTLTRIAMAARKSGPLFLNSLGNAWTSNAIRCRMKGLREKLKLPAGTVAYSYRHTFTTNAILNGTNIASVAELLGHSDLKMLARHYAHLDKSADHLKAAAANAVRRKP